MAREREALKDLAVALAEVEATASDRQAVDQAIADLDQLFLLVVVGEFNAGKSALINAIAGQPILEEGVLPTTAAIHVVTYGRETTSHTRPDGIVDRTVPAELLRDLAIVDTPGTNAVVANHAELSERFVPRSDLVLFVTSVDRPFTESERAFMAIIREWGKKIVIVLNKIDTLADPADQERVVEFVRTSARQLLAFEAEVFPVSARLAASARKLPPGPERDAIWRASQVERLTGYLAERLDEAERLRLKLLSPVGVALRVTERYLEALRERQKRVEADAQTIDTVERELAQYRVDMVEDVRAHGACMGQYLAEVELRGRDFIDDTFRLARIFDLLKTDRIKAEFERRVTADLEERLNDEAQAVSGKLADRQLRIWERIGDYLAERELTRSRDQIVGPVQAPRQESPFGPIVQKLREAIRTYDQRQEADRLGDSIQGAVASTFVLTAGGVGLGAVVLAVTSAVWLDVTGLSAAIVGAALGLWMIPRRRGQTLERWKTTMADLREKLITTVERQCLESLDESLGRIRDALAPLFHYARHERDTVSARQARLDGVHERLVALRSELK
ncbi:MAG: dynamin family protein [Chloroflexi bacterium]|nr:dynamin family protein [Chloroflexota bacterium]